MKRGDLVTVAAQGDFGKPRPGLVVRADVFHNHPTVTVLLLTSTVLNAPAVRVTVHPNTGNGLKIRSQVMIDKAMTFRVDRIGAVFGSIDHATLAEVDRRLAFFLGLV